ncbi:MAG: sigma factor [Flavitalea sp.]
MDINEASFIYRFRQGDPETFHVLYDQYAPLIYGIIRKNTINDEVAGEVLRCVFSTAFRERESFSPSRQRIFTWLYVISDKIICNHSFGEVVTTHPGRIKMLHRRESV